MSETRKYRTFSPEQKLEIVLAGLRGDRAVRDVCREYEYRPVSYVPSDVESNPSTAN